MIKGNKLFGLSFMLIGGAFVLSSLVVMNRFGSLAPSKEVDKKTVFEVAKSVKKKKKRKKKKIKKITKRKPKRMKSIKPSSLMSNGPGTSFGIDGLELNLNDIDQSLLGNTDGLAMTEDSVDKAPIPKRRMPPEYPSSARGRGISGHVVLNLLVNKKGNVEKVRVLEGIPTGVFDDAAVDAVRNWTFRPGTYKGGPVVVWVKQKVVFKLN